MGSKKPVGRSIRQSPAPTYQPLWLECFSLKLDRCNVGFFLRQQLINFADVLIG